MKTLQKRTVRPRFEYLEDRTVPTFTSTSIVATSGNFSATIVTDSSQFNIFYDGPNAELELDDGGAVTVITGVYGNITITLSTTENTSAFTVTNTFEDTLGGNFSLTVNRASTTLAADVAFATTGTAATILGSLNVTVSNGAASTVTLDTGDAMTIGGNATIRTLGGTAAAVKTVELTAASDPWVVYGAMTVDQVNNFDFSAALSQVNGTMTVKTRASSLVGNTNTVDIATGTVLGNLSMTLGSVSGGGSSNVTLGTQVNGFTTISMGTNTTANTTNTLAFDGFTSLGSLISVTGGNGGKTISFEDVSAPLARLTVSLGNATVSNPNLVNFVGSNNSFAYVTLVGGLGSNVVSGLIPSPFRVIRFSF